MRFIAHYIHRHHEKPDYWLTFYGDTQNEALRIADKRVRKGFILHTLKQQLGKD